MACDFGHRVHFLFGAVASQPAHPQRVKDEHQRGASTGSITNPSRTELRNAHEQRGLALLRAEGLHQGVCHATAFISNESCETFQSLDACLCERLAFECQSIRPNRGGQFRQRRIVSNGFRDATELNQRDGLVCHTGHSEVYWGSVNSKGMWGTGGDRHNSSCRPVALDEWLCLKQTTFVISDHMCNTT